MRSDNSNLTNERNAQNNASPFIWLLVGHVGDTEALRLCNYDTAVTFDGQTYSPFPFSIGRQHVKGLLIFFVKF